MGAANRFVFEGGPEFRAALATMPARLAAEGRALVARHAQTALVDIYRGYPEKTGALRSGLSLRMQETRGGARAVLATTAPHAWIADHGTGKRMTKGRGKYRVPANRGTMPAPPREVFVPTVIRERDRLAQGIRALLQREGLEVIGDAA